MKHLREKVNTYLELEPKFRERHNKDRGIVNLLIKQYPILATIPKEILIEVVKDNNQMDRYWRKILEETPRLRGRDYDEKVVLEQNKQIDLGYTPGFDKDVKTLNTLFKI